jgi:RimJ/RimL family protein N-acetyltransferase
VPLPFPSAGVTDGVVGLRRWRRDDLDALVAACQDSEIARWTTVPSSYTADTGTWFLDQCDAWWTAGSDLPVAVVEPGTDRLLGATGVHRIGAAEDTPGLGGLPDEVGYWLGAEARGRGVITRAVQLLATWWFAAMDRPCLWLRARPDNSGSLAVARRCGFVATGVVMPDEADPSASLVVYRRDRSTGVSGRGFS